MLSLAESGLGMQIVWADEAYYGLLEALFESRGQPRRDR